MELHFVGTHHYNLRHRFQVTHAYEGMLNDYHGGQHPAFIAVEASEHQFAHIRDVERRELRRLVEQEWPKAANSWDLFAASMCFEGDAHTDSELPAIRDARIVWLDDADTRDPTGMASRWLWVLHERSGQAASSA